MQAAILFSRPAPRSRLLNAGIKAEMNASIAMSLTSSWRDDDLRSRDEMSSENSERIRQMMRAANILKVREERKYAEKSSSLPLSSATYFANAWESPKSEISWMKETMRVSTVSVPMSSCVIALARNAIPRVPISVIRMFRSVKYMDPVATLEASSVSSPFFKAQVIVMIAYKISFDL